MFQSKVFIALVVTYCLYSIGDCRFVPSEVSRGQHGAARANNGISGLDCSQFHNDHDVLRQLFFPVKLNPISYESEEKSTASMNEDDTFIESLTIQNEDHVPLTIFCLSNLTLLHIQFTPFENGLVPDALANLKTLKYLNIISTPIKQMTQQLSTLTNLEGLMIYNCSLTHLPDISNLDKLNSLNLPFNNFFDIEQLQDLNLQGLDLSGNNLTQIPTLKNKENLVYLSLNNNPLKNADSVVLYPNLHYLYIADAMLTSLPSTIDQLQKLEYLLIYGNQLTELPSSIFNLPKLQYLITDRNLFTPKYIQTIREAFQKDRPSTVLWI